MGDNGHNLDSLLKQMLKHLSCKEGCSEENDLRHVLEQALADFCHKIDLLWLIIHLSDTTEADKSALRVAAEVHPMGHFWYGVNFRFNALQRFIQTQSRTVDEFKRTA